MKCFQSFRLDTANHFLWRGQERVQMAPKSYDVLRYLVENPGRLVTPNELLEALWPETYVNPEVLRKYILDIRKTLGDRPDKPEFIETVTKRGYRFIAPVVEDSPTELPESPVIAEEKIGAGKAPPKRDRLGDKSRVRPAGILAGVAILVVLLAGFYWTRRDRSPALGLRDTSIAVLPFADMSPAKDQEYFSDGLTEELINDLAKVQGLRVVARSSAFQFKGKNEDLRSVAQKLGVANVLEGSVRKEGNRVRITAALSKAEDGFQLWSQTYDRETKDIFAIQDEIALAATEALQLKLLGGNGQPVASKLRSANPDAYQAYLEAQYFAARGRDKHDLEEALAYADQAIKLDASYAPAWAQRALVLEAMASFGLRTYSEGYAGARESAMKAIALDPNLAAGYRAMGLIQTDHDWDWQGADDSFRRAGLLEPGSGEVLADRAYLARNLGQLDQTLELLRQAIARDPLSAEFHLLLGYELYFIGEYEQALAALQRTQELNPEISSLHLTRGKILFAQGHQQEALAEMERETGEWEKLSGEALAYYAVGRREEADKILNKLIVTHQTDSAYQIAEAYAYRGETDKAFKWLEQAYRQRDPGLPELKTGPLMRSLRADARYGELLRQMRLAE
jgi:TolB-like protein/DNA-binding winged helix-turn-helix (wHTH) protein/Flp pilus assembly protein TadD